MCAAALVAALAASGCAAAKRPAATSPGSLPAADAPVATELEAIATARRASIRSLRGTGKLQVTVDAARGGEIRRQRLAASQSLLVRAPDAFRLEALTPFGVGYVVAADGARIAAFAPAERVLWRGEADRDTVAAATGVSAEPADVVALLLGVAPVPSLDLSRARVSRVAATSGETADDAAPDVLLHAAVLDRPGDLVVLGFARPAAAAGAWVPVLYERSTLGGDLVLRARFGDFAPSPAGPIARRVEIATRDSEAVLRCTEFEANPSIEDTVFSLPTPPGVHEQRFVEPGAGGGVS